MTFNGPFKHDHRLAYISWNIIQKIKASHSMHFKVHENMFAGLCDEILQSVNIIQEMNIK